MLYKLSEQAPHKHQKKHHKQQIDNLIRGRHIQCTQLSVSPIEFRKRNLFNFSFWCILHRNKLSEAGNNVCQTEFEDHIT